MYPLSDPSAGMLLAAAYGLGCIAFGYYWVWLTLRQDIRSIGSGGTGATNVGRLLGFKGFFITLLLDGAKGSFAVIAARWMAPDSSLPVLALICVVVGHIWPIQLQFRGGKGVATLLGGIAALDASVLMVLGGLFALMRLLMKSYKLAGLAAFAALPAVLQLLSYPPGKVAGLSLLVGMILWTHRTFLREALGRTTATHRKNSHHRELPRR